MQYKQVISIGKTTNFDSINRYFRSLPSALGLAAALAQKPRNFSTLSVANQGLGESQCMDNPRA
jgi:hypothetical protein